MINTGAYERYTIRESRNQFFKFGHSGVMESQIEFCVFGHASGLSPTKLNFFLKLEDAQRAFPHAVVEK